MILAWHIFVSLFFSVMTVGLLLLAMLAAADADGRGGPFMFKAIGFSIITLIIAIGVWFT